jgi:NADPH:quinone reductase-like Zn-dependent oxidoreductase
MRAIQVTRLDGPEAVELNDVDEPTADDAGIVIDVHAAGVAFPDALLTRGLYQYKPKPPFIIGGEVAGVVRNAPAGAQVAPGDRVLGLTMITGGMAEVVVLSPDRVFKLPDNISFEAGAGVLFNDLTVHFALRTRGRLMPGETVLVHGAAGGIGTSTLRLAPALGAARTIAVVSTEDKIAVAKAAGATDVVLAHGFKDAVAELTGGRGVDIVLDPVGGDRFTDSLRSLAPAGRLLVVGFTGGDIPTIKVNRLLLNNIDAVGVGWGAWSLTHPGQLAEQWDELEALLAAGKVAPPQPQVFRLENAGEAIASLENRTARGKVVLRVRG